MRLSQVLVITVASLLFASDTVAVATSNQANLAISKMAPSQRLLRSNKYPIKEEDEEEDLSEDSIDVQERDFTAHDEEDLEERSPLSDAVVKKLNTIANGWGTSYSSVAMGRSSISQAKASALLALRDAYVSGDRGAKAAAKMAILRANKK
ncbi:hypothetical protein DVH05_000828 [Phytophthora capsici]|nr:hypothetical protein DVH05_000828 [Phytophthora capsici]